MKFIKTKSVEILTNGSLNFTESLTIPKQLFVYKKDHKSMNFSQKFKNTSNNEKYNSAYKNYYK